MRTGGRHTVCACYLSWPYLACALLLMCGALGAADPPQPHSFAETCFDDFSGTAEFPDKAAVERLLLPAPGTSLELTSNNQSGMPITQFRGLGRLATPWTEGQALRISLVNPQPLQIFLWNGNHGVALSFSAATWQHWSQWAAFAVTRAAGQPRPESYRFWAADEGRFLRTGAGTFELHCEAGALVMTRGDVMLLRVPFDGLPGEVWFDGQMALRGLAFAACRGLPPAAAPWPQVLLARRLADLPWTQPAPAGTQWGAPAEGGLTWTVEPSSKAPKSQSTLVSADVPQVGVCDYVFELDDPQPGTGVFLGTDSGSIVCRLAFVENHPSGKLAFSFGASRSPEYELAVHATPGKGWVPFAGGHTWVRLMAAAGIARCWLSGDGVHWSQFEEKPLPVNGACRKVGLWAFGRGARRTITLRSLRIGRLDVLDRLVPEAVAKRVPPVEAVDNLALWIRAIGRDRPEDVPPALWRRACSLRLLSAGPPLAVGQSVLGDVLEEWSNEAGDFAQQARLLDQAALLADTWDAKINERFLAFYERLDRQLLARRDPAPFTRVWQAMLAAPLSPLVTGAALPKENRSASGYPAEGLHYELLAAAFADRWEELAESCRRIQYWGRHNAYHFRMAPWDEGQGYLVEWCAAQANAHLHSGANREAPDEPLPPRAAVRPPKGANRKAWPRAYALRQQKSQNRYWTLLTESHPLVERFGRDEFNVAAELNQALANQSFREAAELITSNPCAQADGLVPIADDTQRCVALSVLVEQAVAANPPLQQILQSQFASIGELREKEGVAAGDPVAVECAAIQFAGTSAAATAHAWLGDRDLSAGRFSDAIGHYRAAWAWALPEQKAFLEPRLRLAGAELGLDLGHPLAEPVQLGAARWEAADFERLLAELRSQRGQQVSAAPDRAPPAPSAYRAKDAVDLQLGALRALDHEYRECGIAVGAAEVENRLLLASPTHVAAVDPQSGRRLWTATTDGDDKQLRNVALPMQPLVVGGRVIVRRLTNQGLELAALDLADGHELWTHRRSDAALVTDPLLVQGALCVLTSSLADQERQSLRLARCQLESGALLDEVPLANFRDVWKVPIACRVASVDGRVVIVGGGCVICCDAHGRVAWQRRQTYIPDPRRASFTPRGMSIPLASPVLIRGERIYVTQPGMWRIECLDLASGKLLWHQADPFLRRTLGVSAAGLVVETTHGLAVWNTEDGTLRWTVEEDLRGEYGTFAGIAGGRFDHAEVLLYAAFRPDPRVTWRRAPALVWRNARTGELIAAHPLDGLDEIEVPKQLPGPLIIGSGKQWLLVSRDRDGADYKLRELVAEPHP